MNELGVEKKLLFILINSKYKNVEFSKKGSFFCTGQKQPIEIISIIPLTRISSESKEIEILIKLLRFYLEIFLFEERKM